jgi:hypothetical protein
MARMSFETRFEVEQLITLIPAIMLGALAELRQMSFKRRRSIITAEFNCRYCAAWETSVFLIPEPITFQWPVCGPV